MPQGITSVMARFAVTIVWDATTTRRLSTHLTDFIPSNLKETDIIDVLVQIPGLADMTHDRIRSATDLQKILVKLYGIAYACAVAHEMPLLNINVIACGFCGYDPTHRFVYERIVEVDQIQRLSLCSHLQSSL